MDEQIHKYDHLISEWKTNIIALYDIVGTDSSIYINIIKLIQYNNR